MRRFFLRSTLLTGLAWSAAGLAGSAAGLAWSPATGLAAAQTTGTVAGTVTDAETGQPMAGAQVGIPALGIGVLSRAGGRFVLPGVPVGTHELLVQRIGHTEATATVTVAAGETALVDIAMEPAVLELQGVVVTGTAFTDSPVDAPYSVAVSGRRALAEQGSPTAVDLFRNLESSAGVLGDRQGWYTTRPAAAVPETVANVNLRGIGPSRTLVLLNGRRQVYVPARLAGGRFVDVNAFPSIALDRVEVVKEGASAVYGSDAVAGVANFLTRSSFEGIEATASHEWFSGAGESSAGAIWGARIGERAHAVVSAEGVVTQALPPEEREWALGPFVAGTGAWSYTGNPGAFLFPRLNGDETKEQFSAALLDAQFGGWGGVFVDPQCTAFGGHREGETCRFNYQPWDNIIPESRHLRVFGELNGELSDRTRYHAEALWAEAASPGWLTTPSYPPISPYNGAQVLGPDHPGRQEFCRAHGSSAGFATDSDCLANDWYFYGRLVGNTGPGRTLDRSSRGQRLSASLAHDLGEAGSRLESLEVAASYSRSTGNVNLPAEYAYRKFLAFRGFGGPDCGVGVVADPNSPSGMALGALGGAVAGQGGCMYYNPFSNANRRSAQPGALYRGQDNPDYVAGLANSDALLDWINEEVNLDNAAQLMVGDATVKGTLAEDAVVYAVGYQFRWLDVSAVPNAPGDLSINPCPVLGDRSCIEKAGAFTFTTGHYDYSDAQTVNRVFAETQIELAGRAQAQLAANFESHGPVSSFDPKAAVRFELAEPVALRASLQTTFRTPSVDDLNEDRNTSLEYVSEAGIYKAVDQVGDGSLEPERAFTYNVGATLQLPRVRATLDYWNYDFRDVIDVIPVAGVTALYDAGGASRAAVQNLVTCPDGRGTGTCDTSALERIEARNVNWPGIELSGIDGHLSARLPVGTAGGGAVLSAGAQGTYLRSFLVKALEIGGAELFQEQQAAGQLNWNNPIAPPLPKWKTRYNVGYHAGDYSAVSYLNLVSGYRNEVFAETEREDIDRFATVDLSVLRRSQGGMDVAVSLLNALDADPPYVAWEQAYDGFTHNPKGRRVKVSVTWRGR